MKIDAHIKLGDCYTGETYRADDYLLLMEKHGIDLAIISPYKPLSNDLSEANERIAEYIEKFPNKFIGTVRVNPWQREEALKMAEQWLEKGFKGIHLFPWEETFQVNDELVYPLVELAEVRQVPVVIEAGYPIVSHVTKIADLAYRYPNVKFYMTNAGQLDLSGDSINDVGYFMELLDNLHMGTSSAVAYMWLASLIKDGKIGKRIHFESNYPFTDPYMEIYRIETNPITDHEKELVFFRNTKRLFNL
ncbi:MAG: amidohydrolase family protein [Clostridiales bacterium]|nr:amidohydrolase family protein [Clostridiales bacterium]